MLYGIYISGAINAAMPQQSVTIGSEESTVARRCCKISSLLLVPSHCASLYFIYISSSSFSAFNYRILIIIFELNIPLMTISASNKLNTFAELGSGQTRGNIEVG